MQPPLTPSHYNWHPQKWGRYLSVAAAGGLCAWAWFIGGGQIHWFPVGVTVMLAVVSWYALVEQDTQIDARARVVIRERRLLGRLLVWRSRDRLTGFVGIGFRRVGLHDEATDTVTVGLQRRSGRLLPVQYFIVPTGQRSDEAERAGQSLAELTGLKLLPTPD